MADTRYEPFTRDPYEREATLAWRRVEIAFARKGSFRQTSYPPQDNEPQTPPLPAPPIKGPEGSGTPLPPAPPPGPRDDG